MTPDSTSSGPGTTRVMPRVPLAAPGYQQFTQRPHPELVPAGQRAQAAHGLTESGVSPPIAIDDHTVIFAPFPAFPEDGYIGKHRAKDSHVGQG